MKNERFLSINLTHKMGKNESNYFKVKILIPDKLNEYNIFPHIWFSLKSDKCCVQHGHIKAWSNNPQITITLLKQYANTNYGIWTQDQGSSADNTINGITVKSKSVGSFILQPYTNCRYGYWYTLGFVN